MWLSSQGVDGIGTLAGFCANVDEDGVLGVDAVGCCPWGMFADEDVREREGRWDAETWDASQFDRGIQLSEPRAVGDQRPSGEAREAEGRAAKVVRPSLRERAVVVDRGWAG